MTKIENALWKDYDKANELISVIDGNDERYKLLLEERDKIRNELIKLEQVDVETKIKKEQIEAENKREKIRNGVSIGTFVVSTCVSLYAINKTFRFDQEATVTSTLGRGILNGVVPKINIFKR